MPDVLLIGWDGADWQQIHPLLDAGEMPNLARLVEGGVMGDLAGLTPRSSSLLWTSLATGVYADRHGVLDWSEPDPVTGGIRPATRASLRALQLWDVLGAEGLDCRVVGWPVTHPATGPAICVSDGFAHAVPGSIYPPELEGSIGPLRFDPQEWTGSELELFVPRWREVDQDRDRGLARLAVILAEAVSVHAAASTLMESGPAALTAVWYGTVAKAAAAFPDASDEIYGQVVSGAYRFLDLFLGRLVALAGPETVVMLVSDRAAAAGDDRGMFCAAGPGIEADELAFGAGLLDIAPTVLALAGFAKPEGMPGHAMPEASKAAPARRVADWRTVPESEAEEESGAAELEALGYTDAVAPTRQADADAARRRRSFHLARVLSAQGRHGEAVPLLEKLAAEADAADVRLRLAHAYYETQRLDDCRRVCESLLAEMPDCGAEAVAEAYLAIARGDVAEARRQLRSARESYGVAAALDAAIGWACLRVGSWEEAEAAFRSAIAAEPAAAASHEGLARAMVGAGRHAEAAEAALDSIRLRYDWAPAHEVLAAALERMGRKDAAEQAHANSRRLRQRPPAA